MFECVASHSVWSQIRPRQFALHSHRRGGGVVFSDSFQAGRRFSAQKSCAAGYEKGQSDSAKRQYQALTGRQRLAPQSDDAGRLQLFDVRFARLFPEREQNGVILAAGTATLRIQQ